MLLLFLAKISLLYVEKKSNNLSLFYHKKTLLKGDHKETIELQLPAVFDYFMLCE